MNYLEIFDSEMKEQNKENESSLLLNNIEIIDLLNNMINLKKENKNLKKRINFLENLLKNSLSKKSLEDYITNDLLIECNEKEKILYNLIPDKNLEVLYQVGELTFKRRKHYKKNNNNQEKKIKLKKERKKTMNKKNVK
jgi:hypothetical protein